MSYLKFGDLASYRYGPGSTDPYDPDKLGLGPLMIQSNGATEEDDWAGPLPLAIHRPFEALAVPFAQPRAVNMGGDDYLVVAGEVSTAAVTRRIGAWKYNKATGVLTYLGYITLTFPAATNHTIRDLRLTRDLHTAGTVSVAGNAVTGVGTGWQAGGACIGNRIGFGSTNPAEITQWYEISAMASDTGLTLSVAADTIAPGTPYVIEDWRVAVLTTNATVTNGGLFVAKGLRPEIFIATTIPAATTVDNIRAVYWLKDAATETNTTGWGIGLQDSDHNQYNHTCWVLNGTVGTPVLYCYNLRAPLTGLASGASTAALILISGAGGAGTGTISQYGNLRCVTLGHGPGAGLECLYWVTSTRVYRSIAVSGITPGLTNWVADAMTEVPPGGVNTYAAGASFIHVEYAASIDRLLVSCYALNNVLPDYLTKYNASGNQLDRIFGATARRLNYQTTDSGAPPVLDMYLSLLMTYWMEDGLAFVMSSVASNQNFLIVLPLGADWEFAATTNCCIITPRIATPDADEYLRALVASEQYLGSQPDFAIATEPYRIAYRTAGIDDDTGAWTLLPSHGSLSGVAGAPYIQYRLEFRTLGQFCLPARVHGIGTDYDVADSLPPDVQWSLEDSSNSNGTAGFVQTAELASLTLLTITYRRNDTGAVVLVQDSASTSNGTFEYHNGSAWVAGIGPNANGQRRRFVPSAGLPVGVTCSPTLRIV